MGKVVTGALAIVKVNGVVVGKMQDVGATEDIQRTDIYGLGEVVPSESAVVRWSGRLTCSFMSVDFKKSGLPEAIRRDTQSIQAFVDNLLLDSEGIQVDIYQKVEDYIDPDTGLRKAKTEPYASIQKCLINSDGFSVTEGAVVRKNQSFTYITPMTFPS